MKKFFLIFALAFLLCGCQKTGPEYLVSGIGFDSKDGKYNVCFETIIINTENTAQTVRLLKGERDTVKNAVRQINAQCTQPLLMAHCGVVVIGEDITYNQLKEVGDYCYNEDEITLSAYFVRTDNAEKLFSLKPISSASVGYDVMGLVKRNKRFNNRVFEVVNSDYKATVPRISIKEKGIKFDEQ